jgi:hypothetical protein
MLIFWKFSQLPQFFISKPHITFHMLLESMGIQLKMRLFVWCPSFVFGSLHFCLWWIEFSCSLWWRIYINELVNNMLHNLLKWLITMNVEMICWDTLSMHLNEMTCRNDIPKWLPKVTYQYDLLTWHIEMTLQDNIPKWLVEIRNQNYLTRWHTMSRNHVKKHKGKVDQCAF